MRLIACLRSIAMKTKASSINIYICMYIYIIYRAKVSNSIQPSG